ncbi:MAG: GNAT family N-acetyltransferase [Promethearchaeota archaeon]|jgi:ribosomal protein S18 acetylase RimI-like enzyme
MNELDNLIRLSEGNIKAACEMLARAFYNAPSFLYLLPNADERSRILPEIFEFMVRYGIMYGEVYNVSPNLKGCAGWLPYWEAEITDENVYKCVDREMLLRWGLDFWRRSENLEKWKNRCHKTYANFPHLYLFYIGVDPVYQGKGHASKLMRNKFAEISEKNVPCYLETDKEQNVSIYQHFGFEIVEEGVIPETDVRYWAMLRKIE